MSKKILSVLLAVMMLFAVLTGCASKCRKEPEKKPSGSGGSKIESTIDDVSSGIAGVEDDESGSSHPYKWQLQTTSHTFRDDPAAQISATTSTAIKQWKNPDSVQIGCYHLQLQWCDAYGTDLQSRIREFQEVVDMKCFNTFILDGTSTEYLTYELPIIAEAGATFWVGFGLYHSKNETIEAYTERIRKTIDFIKDNGYGDIFNGVIWDEPLLNAQASEDFYKQSEVHYKVFGLRNNPVFSLYEFNEFYANAPGSDYKYGQIKPEHCKYVTDVGFDAYSVDVREGVVFPQASLDRWEAATGMEHSNGRDYYTNNRKYLMNYIGHDANWWHFPCAFGIKTLLGGVADEAYCMGQLEFLVQDMLSAEYPGGVFVYGYYTWRTDPTAFVHIALTERIPIKDEFGHYTHYPEQEKWPDYFELLKKTREMLDSKKQKLVDLGL